MKSLYENTFGFFESKDVLHIIMTYLLLFFSFNLDAAEDLSYWKSIGPEGANVTSFKQKQGEVEIIQAFDLAYDGSTQAILKSYNSGNSWVKLPTDTVIKLEDEQQFAENNSDINILATDIKNADILSIPSPN